MGGGIGRLTGSSYTRATALVDARKPTRVRMCGLQRSDHALIITPIRGHTSAHSEASLCQGEISGVVGAR